MWPFKEKEKKIVCTTEFTISNSGMDVLSQYEREMADLLWNALENHANQSNAKHINSEDVKKVGEQVIIALKQLIEEFE